MQKDPDMSRKAPKITKVLVTACLIFLMFLSAFVGMGIDGIVPLIQKHYTISDSATAMIRARFTTSSSITHTITLALVWILGDSFKRRRLFLSSVSLWIACNLISIFWGSSSFTVFVAFHALGSAASSVFGVLVPVLLADLFQDRALGVALTCLAMCEMASNLLTGIISSWIVTSDIAWQSGLLSASLLAILPLFVLLFLKNNIRNVERFDQSTGVGKIISSAFGIFSIKSYLLMTTASALGMLHISSYGFWFPSVYLLVWQNVPEIFFGMSYTAITILNSITMLTGTSIGLPSILWFAQSWRHGTGPFLGRKGYSRAYPIVIAVGGAVNVGMFVCSILLMDKSYVASLVIKSSHIHLGNAAGAALGQQMSLMVVPSTSRAASFALARLIAGVIATPSAQFVGLISDAIRGDSTLPYDRFHAYQLAMLSTTVFIIASAICNFTLIFSFPGDCERAQQQDSLAEDPSDEKVFLNGKGRAESILETMVRSRTTTLNSYFDVQ